MRIKTIEKVLSLRRVHSIIKKIIGPYFAISQNSLISDENLLIIAVNNKNLTLIIRASVDTRFERTFLSVLVLTTNALFKKANLNYTIEDEIEEVANKIKSLLKSKGNYALYYPFIGFSNFESKIRSEKRKLLKIETKILNLLVHKISKIYKYSDSILKFPFSISYIDGKREYWEKKYYSYLVFVEEHLKKLQSDQMDIYKNYDFALERDIFPRIIDLVITEKFKVERDLKQKDIGGITEFENSEIYNYILTFVYCNRTSKPYELMNLLKFMNEIKSYAKKFKLKRKKTCYQIRYQMIIVSLLGFGPKVKQYLRNHLFRQTDYIIPIMIIPPTDNNVWHNFIDYENSEIIKSSKRKELEKFIRVTKSQDISATFKFTRGKTALSEYEEMIEKEKIAKVDKEFLDKWSLILDVSNSKRLLEIEDSAEELSPYHYIGE
ncbi:MAG: hypothetical protein ACFE9R_08230 [Candidatus Hermodarchaeota archaeon]